MLSFEYKNHKGIKETRTVTDAKLVYLTKPGHDYQAGWFIDAFCKDRKARRSFALTNITVDLDFPKTILGNVHIE